MTPHPNTLGPAAFGTDVPVPREGVGRTPPGRRAARGVVLVHGLYHRTAHFGLVAGVLRAAGVAVAVPELHRGSLDADTAAVQSVVDGFAEPPVVLGHSYGGSVITGLRGAGHLVYVAAFAPDAGQSAASLGGSTALLRAAIVPGANGVTSVRSDLAAELFYPDCSPELGAWAVASLREQGPGCGRGVPRRQAWKDTPSTYVVCARDRAVDPAVQRSMARRCTTSEEWPTGHSPFVACPERLAGLLYGLAGAPAPDRR